MFSASKWGKFAFVPAELGIQLVDETLIEATLVKARSSPRLRANHNFHASESDGFHRFLNAMVRGTYAAPHRHLTIPKPESFLAVRGKVACFVFDDAGRPMTHAVLGAAGVWGIDIAAGFWHTVLPLTQEAVCFEVKPGPWDPTTDKQFAPWAPREGEPAAAAYAATLLTAVGQY